MKRGKQIFMTGCLVAAFALGIGSATAKHHADAAAVKIEAANFPDERVRMWVNKWDTNKDGSLSDAEIQAVTSARLDPLWTEEQCKTLVDFTGLQYFTNLKKVSINLEDSNPQYKRWMYKDTDMSKYFPYVEELSVGGQYNVRLTGKYPKLRTLSLYGTDIMCDVTAPNVTELLLSMSDGYGEAERKNHLFLNRKLCEQFPAVRKLYCVAVTDAEKQLYGFQHLEDLTICHYNIKDKTIDLSPYKDTLRWLQLGICSGDGWIRTMRMPSWDHSETVTSLDLSMMSKLERVSICDMINLQNLILVDQKGQSALKNLKELYVLRNKVKSLDLSQASSLKVLKVGGRISTLDVQNCKQLKQLYIVSNYMKKLTVKNSTLRDFYFYGTNLTKLDVKGCPQLRSFNLPRYRKKSFKRIDLRKNKKLQSIWIEKKVSVDRIILPLVKNKKYAYQWMKAYLLTDYSLWGNYSAKVLDLSEYKKLPAKLTKLKIKKVSRISPKLKKIVINKKLSKKDRKWLHKALKGTKIKIVKK